MVQHIEKKAFISFSAFLRDLKESAVPVGHLPSHKMLKRKLPSIFGSRKVVQDRITLPLDEESLSLKEAVLSNRHIYHVPHNSVLSLLYFCPFCSDK